MVRQILIPSTRAEITFTVQLVGALVFLCPGVPVMLSRECGALSEITEVLDTAVKHYVLIFTLKNDQQTQKKKKKPFHL